MEVEAKMDSLCCSKSVSSRVYCVRWWDTVGCQYEPWASTTALGERNPPKSFHLSSSNLIWLDPQKLWPPAWIRPETNTLVPALAASFRRSGGKGSYPELSFTLKIQSRTPLWFFVFFFNVANKRFRTFTEIPLWEKKVLHTKLIRSTLLLRLKTDGLVKPVIVNNRLLCVITHDARRCRGQMKARICGRVRLLLGDEMTGRTGGPLIVLLETNGARGEKQMWDGPPLRLVASRSAWWIAFWRRQCVSVCVCEGVAFSLEAWWTHAMTLTRNCYICLELCWEF